MIHCTRVEIRKNEGATLNEAYPDWEIPILQVVHGIDNVKIVGDKLVDRPVPDAHDEFQRLNNRYRRSRDENDNLSTPYVHMVYGQMGVQKLAEAIEKAVVEAPKGDLLGESQEPHSSVGG